MEQAIKTFTLEGLERIVKEAGLPAFRAGQLGEWLYGKGVASYDDMTNLPKTMREQFKELYPLHNPTIVEKQLSSDGSRKYLVQFHDGAFVETVGLPSKDGRLTVCLSSQAGCAMQCAFCATGKAGLTRNLAVGEMVDQIRIVADDFGERVTNIVVMGQGEPFANYDAVLGALRIVNHPKLLSIGARHITVSTCGIVQGINRFANEPEQFTLAVSLHSARQDVRNSLMPRVSEIPLPLLREALQSYAARTGRRFSFEYALMRGCNDASEDLDALIAYCKGLLCHVNLIPLNEVEDSHYKPVSHDVLDHWCRALESAGIAATVRNSRGSDIAAACGQLANKAR